jgi:hypothetical protein
MDTFAHEKSVSSYPFLSLPKDHPLIDIYLRPMAISTLRYLRSHTIANEPETLVLTIAGNNLISPFKTDMIATQFRLHSRCTCCDRQVIRDFAVLAVDLLRWCLDVNGTW